MYKVIKTVYKDGKEFKRVECGNPRGFETLERATEIWHRFSQYNYNLINDDPKYGTHYNFTAGNTEYIGTIETVI